MWDQNNKLKGAESINKGRVRFILYATSWDMIHAVKPFMNDNSCMLNTAGVASQWGSVHWFPDCSSESVHHYRETHRVKSLSLSLSLSLLRLLLACFLCGIPLTVCHSPQIITEKVFGSFEEAGLAWNILKVCCVNRRVDWRQFCSYPNLECSTGIFHLLYFNYSVLRWKKSNPITDYFDRIIKYWKTAFQHRHLWPTDDRSTDSHFWVIHFYI